MKKYTVFSARIANELVKKGYPVVDTGINFKCPQYRVFMFEDTEELREALDSIKSQTPHN